MHLNNDKDNHQFYKVANLTYMILKYSILDNLTILAFLFSKINFTRK